ncbi:MAG: hypothetical protein AAGD96_06955 [Chloroflexota bacterium]
MRPDLTITDVSFTTSIAYTHNQENVANISCVQLTLSDGATFRGDCLLPSEWSIVSQARAISTGLAQKLVGKTPENFIELCQQVTQAQFVVEEYRIPDPADASSEEMQKKARREMLSIIGIVDQIEPEPILTPIVYPVPNHVVRGATAALLRAVAHAHNQSLPDFVQGLLKERAEDKSALRLGLDVSLASKTAFLHHISAVCYTLPHEAGAESLGKSVEKLQKYIRELNGWIEGTWAKLLPEERPWLFVDLNGTIHELNNRVMGKTLGSLFGFSTTGFQERMIFANPLTAESVDQTIKDFSLLRSLMKSRKLQLQAVPSASVNTLSNMENWIQKDKGELLVVHLDHVSSLGELLEMLKAATQADKSLILHAESMGNERTWQLAHTIAQAVCPLFYLPAGGEKGLIQAVNLSA